MCFFIILALQFSSETLYSCCLLCLSYIVYNYIRNRGSYVKVLFIQCFNPEIVRFDRRFKVNDKESRIFFFSGQ